MTRGVAVGNGPVVAVGSGGAAGIIAVGIGIGVAVGIAASIGGAAVGSGVAVGGGMGVEVGTGIATSAGNEVAVGMGAIVGGITSDAAGAAIGNSSTCTGPADDRRAVAMASTSARGSLPLSGATPVTA
jgi:hypothetical protein